jgi:ketosteroid isomerase-like protein
MSEENVEIVRSMVERWNQRDLQGFLALFSADVECFAAADQPSRRVSRARSISRRANGWFAAFDPYVLEASEYLDLGECVVVVGRVVGTGRESGVTVADDDAWLYRFLDGEVIEYRECGTKANALEAAGLREYAIWRVPGSLQERR